MALLVERSLPKPQIDSLNRVIVNFQMRQKLFFEQRVWRCWYRGHCKTRDLQFESSHCQFANETMTGLRAVGVALLVEVTSKTILQFESSHWQFLFTGNCVKNEQ